MIQSDGKGELEPLVECASTLTREQLIACAQPNRRFTIDIDGVVLKDTYSPVLKKIIEKYNGVYTRELERNAFSRNRKEAATYIANALNLNLTPAQLISEYFQERERYMATHESGIEIGAIDFLTAIFHSSLFSR